MLRIFTLFFLLVTAPLAHGQTVQERLSSHVHILASDSLEGRGLGTRGKDRATAYLVRQFAEIGLEPMAEGFLHTFPLRFQLVNVEAYNVMGLLAGSDPVLRNEYIVIGAHYDHLGFALSPNGRTFFPGADDNASGTAALLELARAMALSPSRPARSVLFVALDAEESGLLGAEEFVRNPPVPLPNVRAMFSLDMVGMLAAHGGLTLTGMGTLDGGIPLARAVAERHSIALKGMGATVERRTDTWPFGREGIPAIHAFTGLTSPYHQPEDTANLLDYTGMATVVNFLHDLVAEMANQPALHPSRALTKQQRPIQLGVRGGVVSHVGTTRHNYADAYYVSRPAYSGGAGALVQLQLSQKFVIQTEVLYDLTRTESAQGILSRHAVTVPVNVQVNMFSDADLARAFLLGGAYARRNLAGKDGPQELDLTSVHRRDEWGVNLGVGMEIYGLQLGYTRRIGGTSILRPPGEKVMPVETYLTLGYRF